MKRLLSTLAGCFGLGFLALTVVLLVQFQDNRKLAEDKRAAESDLQTANARVNDLEREKAALATDLETTRIEVQHLVGRLTGTAPTESQTNEPAAAKVQLKPYQAPAYLGNDYLGLAWVVPRNILKDPRTGRVTFEPAIVLDPGWRGAFASPAVEAAPPPEAPSYSAVYNYYNPWPWVIFPAPHHHHTNAVNRLPPVGPTQPPSRPLVVDLQASAGAMRAVTAPARRPANGPNVLPPNSWTGPSVDSSFGGAVRASFAR